VPASSTDTSMTMSLPAGTVAVIGAEMSVSPVAVKKFTGTEARAVPRSATVKFAPTLWSIA
jgi:hypothetical protein